MQTKLASDTIEKICRISPVIAAPDVIDPRLAGPLARAITRGRVPVIEVSIRGRNAIEVINEMAQIPDAIVGASMVLSPADVEAARDAGAKFCTTPGVTESLLRYFDGTDVPIMPGVSTVTEAMHLLDRGYTLLNFYPAGSSGGATTLAAMNRPLPQIRFCASGGIKAETAPTYAKLANVLSVSGAWFISPKEIAAENWDAITQRAKGASQLKR